MKQHQKLMLKLVLCFLFISLNSHAQSTNSQIATTFMNGMKSFLIEEGFSPKIEDDYLNFKKEGVGFHIQVTGTGPYIFQFYVDEIHMPSDIGLNNLLIDLNNANSTGALIYSVYQEDKNQLSVFIRVAGATRSLEDFKYVFYSYLSGLQLGYNQALSYAKDPGKNFPYPKSLFEHQALKVTNVFIGRGMTVVDFLYDNTNGNDTQIWMQNTAYLKPDGDANTYVMTNAEGISTDQTKKTPVAKNEQLAFRLYFPEIPSKTKRMDFFEGTSTATSFSVWGIELNE
jgi:hypothetical protein